MLLISFRRIRFNLGFTLVAVIPLSAAIAANLTGCLLVERSRSFLLPFPSIEELVVIEDLQMPISYADFLHLQRHSTLVDLTATTLWSMNLKKQGIALSLKGRRVSPNYFEVMGVPVEQGRAFTSMEGIDSDSAIIGSKLWRTQFGSSRQLVGSRLEIDGRSCTVIGIAPSSAGLSEESLGLWILNDDRVSAQLDVTVLGRLREGVSIGQASAELEAIHSNNRLGGESKQPIRLKVEALSDAYLDGHFGSSSPLRPRIYLLFALLGLLLLVGFFNVGNHLAILTANRNKELAVRIALGASPSVIPAKLLAESGLYVLMSALMGLALVIWSLQAGIWQKANIAFEGLEKEIFQPSFGLYLAGLCLLGSMICSLGSLWVGSKKRLVGCLLQRGVLPDPLRAKVPSGKLFAGLQVSLSLVIALAACTLSYTVWRIEHLPLGYETDNVLQVVASLPRSFMARLSEDYPQDPVFQILPRRENFFLHSLERIRALPGVNGVGATREFVCRLGSIYAFRKEGEDHLPPLELYRNRSQTACYKPVSWEYFSSLGMKLREGRPFNRTDYLRGSSTVIVNNAMADRFWPGESAVGKRLQIIFPNYIDYDNYPWSEVIGVAENVREQKGEEWRPILYHPYLQQPLGAQMMPSSDMRLTYLLRISGEPTPELVHLTMKAIAQADPAVSIKSTESLQEALDSPFVFHSLYSRLLFGLSMVTLLVTCVGLYGVTAFSTHLRRRELAIRVASGASPHDTVLSALLPTGKAVLVAIPIGLAGGLIAVNQLAQVITGVSRPPAWISCLTVLGVAGIVVASCYWPARRLAWSNIADCLRDDEAS